jgi:hypothetical protein
MLRAAFGSLRLRLPLLVLIAVIPALGLVLYEAREQRQLAAAHALAEALQLPRLTAQSYQHLLEGTRQLLAGLAHVPALARGDPYVCHPRLTRLLTQYPYYADLGVIAPDSQVLCSAVLLSAHPQLGRSRICARGPGAAHLRHGRVSDRPHHGESQH